MLSASEANIINLRHGQATGIRSSSGVVVYVTRILTIVGDEYEITLDPNREERIGGRLKSPAEVVQTIESQVKS